MAAKSADNNQNPEDPMTSQPEENPHAPAPPAPERATAARGERARCWNEALRRSDVTRLWSELHRVVCSHPLVRASHSAGLLVEGAERGNAYVDLTQELFVTLLAKARFQHYLDSAMTDAEIECEIGQIELTNLLTAELRKRHPESYRLARRISTIIQSSANFRRFDSNGDPADEEQHRRLADRVYGLSEWPDAKARRGAQELEQRAQMIPVRQRDTRMVGCTGDAQIIISNSDLEDLIVSVLEAADAPVDVRGLRSLVMSRLPVMDIYLVPLGGDDSDEGRAFEPVDGRENPEQGLLRRESEGERHEQVARFMEALSTNVRGKTKQYERLIAILRYCYLSPKRYTQLQVAATLGVSDSLVSQCRRRIEQELRALSFAGIAEARDFEEALKEHVSRLPRDSPPKRPDRLQRSPERAAGVCRAVVKGAPVGSGFGGAEKTAEDRRGARINQ